MKKALYDHISHTLSQKMLEQNEVSYNLSCLRWEEALMTSEVKLKMEKLHKLQLSLDKLSFANTTYRGKPATTTSSLSSDEVDKQKLQFLMQHGSRNMADERKLLREISSSQKREPGTTLHELDAPIQKLKEQMENSHFYLHRTDFEGIHKEIKRHEVAREKAVANAAVSGRLWSSLGSKKDIQEQVQVMMEELDELRSKQVDGRNRAKSAEKKLGFIEKQIMFLQKQFDDINQYSCGE